MIIFSDEQKIITAQRLKELRNNKGLSHEKLSVALSEQGVKVSVQALKDYEVTDIAHSKKDSTKGMKIETFFGIAQFYNVSTDYLFGLSGIKSIKDDIKIARKTTGLSEESIKNFMQTKDSGNSEFSQAQDWLITNEILEIMSCICIHIKINSENFINQKTEHHKMNGMERISHNMSLYNAEDSCDVERYKLTKLMESVANNFDKRCSESNNQT